MKTAFYKAALLVLFIMFSCTLTVCKKDINITITQPEVSTSVKVASQEVENKIKYLSKVADTIIFNGTVTDFKVNSIIVSQKDDGVLRKVNNVIQNQGNTVLITSAVSIAEAFPNTDFSTELKITSSDIEDIKFNIKGITLDNSIDDELNFELKEVVLWDKDGSPITSNDQVTADGKISLALNPYLSFKNIDGEVRNVTFGCDPVGIIEISVDCPIVIDRLEPKPILLTTIKPKPRVLVIAGVPIIITNEIPIYIGIKGSTKAKLYGGIKNTTSMHAELSWINGDFSFSKSFKNTIEATASSIASETDLQAFITPELNIKLYGVAGPSVSLKGYVRGEGIVTGGTTEPRLTAAIYGGIELSLGLILKVFDFRLSSYQGPPIIREEIKIKEWTTKLNSPPLKPSVVSPLDYSENNSLSPLLAWTCTDPDGDQLFYNVYFGVTNPPTSKILSSHSITSIGRQNLNNSSTYFWKVVAKDKLGDSTVGPVWRFTTKPLINNPPLPPKSPSPPHETVNQPISPVLCWDCTDPDGDDLSYDVYFGTTKTSLNLLSSNLSSTSFSKVGLLNSTKYYWKVVAKDGKGLTTSSDIWNFTTLATDNNDPGKPSKPVPADESINQPVSLSLGWSCIDPDGDELVYDIYFGTGLYPTILISSDQKSTSLSRINLSNNTTYYWRVVAKDTKGNPISSDVWHFTTLEKVNNLPVKPINQSPLDKSENQPISTVLNWDCSDPDGDILKYDIYFGLNSNPTSLFASDQTSKSINKNGLSYSTTYYWRVIAKDGVGPPVQGDIWSFTTLAEENLQPDKPSIPSPANESKDQALSLTLSWSCTDPDPDKDVLKFDVYFGTSTNPTNQIAYDQSSKSINRSNLNPNTTYFWKVVAKDGTGTPVSGDIWSFKTTLGNRLPVKPFEPSPLDEIDDQPLSLTLSWDCYDLDNNTLKYDIYFGTSSNPTNLISSDQTSQSINRPNLLNNTTYFWRVVAKDGIGDPVQGDIWRFTTQAAPVNHSPEVPYSPGPGIGSTGQPVSITLSWKSIDPDGDAVGYVVYFGTSSNPTTPYSVGQNSFIRNNLSYNTDYYWKVEATDFKGDPVCGPVWSFRTGTIVNTAPDLPKSPTPSDEATGLSTSTTLRWITNDIDGDNLTNTLMLSTSNPPLTIEFQGSFNPKSYSPPGLQANTKYYWQVKSLDSKFALTVGPIWYFTTGSK